MKRLLLAGAAFLGLAASGSGTRAGPIDFTFTGSLVDFTVPATGSYQIIAFGAQGVVVPLWVSSVPAVKAPRSAATSP